jgi:hypothetical protein
MEEMTSIGGPSRTRLKRVHDTMARHVHSGGLPGLVTLISRHGEIHVDAIGAPRRAAKCATVFQTDHAQGTGQSAMAIRLKAIAL